MKQTMRRNVRISTIVDAFASTFLWSINAFDANNFVAAYRQIAGNNHQSKDELEERNSYTVKIKWPSPLSWRQEYLATFKYPA